jgi:short-subunit dehydrogenase
MSFRERYGPWAIVAGASEGVGRSFARAIAAHGVPSLLIANDGPLEEAAAEIRSEFGVECRTAWIDLAKPEAFAEIAAAAGATEIGLYVANAGADAHGARFHDRPVRDWLDLIRLNVLTTAQSCHYFGGLMRERGRGGLLLVNSGACYGGCGSLATYTAVKAFQLNLAESLWSELRPHGVDVLTLVLGQTDTPAYHRLQARKGMPSGPNLAAPDAVAELGLERLPHGPVCNWGLEDADAGHLPASAATRRGRVVAIEAALEKVFGKTTASAGSLGGEA